MTLPTATPPDRTPPADAAARARLDALAARARDEIARTAHPRAPWLTPRTGPDGTKALDVLVAGAGQSGLAAGFALKRARVDNILLVDRAEPGGEGPWRSYARMHTLRSPKDFTGPDLGLPALTYQSWHEARHGTAGWQALGQIHRLDWADYLDWVRHVTGVPVRNGCDLVGIAPAADGLLAATLRSADGRTETVHTRRIVLATGQDSTGRWWMPPSVAALPADRRAHASEAIDFAALRGRRVAVLGAGASAFDNAAMALEHGASVDLFCRRLEPQTVQPYRWLTFAGFLRHLGDLDDAWRWRFMRHVMGLREGFPQASYDRCRAWPSFRLVAGAPWQRVGIEDGHIAIATPRGDFAADFVIAATGIDMDFAARPELAGFAHNIATWADRYTPPDNEQDERLGRFPYLRPDYAFAEKVLGETPWIGRIHLFSIASTMSFGPSGSSINAMTTAVPKLVEGVTRGLFTEDVEAHWASLQAYDERQAVAATD